MTSLNLRFHNHLSITKQAGGRAGCGWCCLEMQEQIQKENEFQHTVGGGSELRLPSSLPGPVDMDQRKGLHVSVHL